VVSEGCQPRRARCPVHVGWLYHHGKGVPEDYQKATEWYLKAVDQGNSSAQFHKGKMYHYGNGVPQDYQKAREWYLKAAEQGLFEAQRMLEELPQ